MTLYKMQLCYRAGYTLLWSFLLVLTSRTSCVFSLSFSGGFGIFPPSVRSLRWSKKKKFFFKLIYTSEKTECHLLWWRHLCEYFNWNPQMAASLRGSLQAEIIWNKPKLMRTTGQNGMIAESNSYQRQDGQFWGWILPMPLWQGDFSFFGCVLVLK